MDVSPVALPRAAPPARPCPPGHPQGQQGSKSRHTPRRASHGHGHLDNDFFLSPPPPSVFSQAGQSQPAPAQQGMYNNMSITVSMAGGNTNVQNINPMAGQMQMNSLQMPGMNSMCSEQVSAVPAPLPGRSASSRGVQRSLLWPWGYRWLKRGAAKIWLSLLALPLCWSPRPPAPRGVLGGCRDVLSTSRPLGRLAAGPFVAVHPPELGKLGLGSGNG